MDTDLVFRIAMVGLYTFLTVVASMLLLNL